MATDPIQRSRVDVGKLPEQIPAQVRAAIRAFYDSGELTAVVTFSTTAGNINGSLASLGLIGEMYAEDRSGEVVLRRVAPVQRRGRR